MMSLDRAVNFTCELIVTQTGKPLNNSEMNVLKGMLDNKTYTHIAELYIYSEGTIRDIGSDLCKKLSASLNIKVTKNNLITVIEQHLPPEQQKISDSEILPKYNDEIRDFVGRDAAITDINTLISERYKIIVIQAAGGVGKTTLAKQYLSQIFDLVLPLEMSKDKENITSVESVVEEWLKQHFKEEPGREFGITLSRLRTQLQNRKVGVLIDNLEPALDERGRFVEKHNGYVRLLDVLADSNVKSFTLITSRERLCDDRVNSIYHYPLAVLTVEAWGEFFTTRKIQIDTPTLEAMHKIYGGNAKAMDILLGVMRTDYDGDMAAYWQENCTCVETELKNLVESQFKRLQTLDTEAYKLLCRLGCFRYQDVPRVSINALLALLWDIPEDKRRDVIKSLRNRCLVEFEKGEYWLHPVIREQGIERLKESGEWEEVNRKAAEFWTESVKTVETIEDAKQALEASFHYLEIRNFDLAGSVIIYERDNKWDKRELLAVSFWRLGLLQQLSFSISRVINYITNNIYCLSELYLLLGYTYNLIGLIRKSIEYHKESYRLADEYLTSHSQLNTIDISTLKIQEVKEVKSAFFVNIACCLIDLYEMEEAIKILEDGCLFISNTLNFDNYFSLESWFLLAFLNSCLGFKQKALYFAEKTYTQLALTKGTTWTQGHSLLFLGLTYKNLMDIDKSFAMYSQAICYADESNYTQVKAKALTGLAELYRIQEDFKKALSHHSESIELLDKIGAKCDLAEAYYQQGLTYQKMGETEKSNTNFNEAIRLFNEMEAPKQVEKVETAKSGNIDS